MIQYVQDVVRKRTYIQSTLIAIVGWGVLYGVATLIDKLFPGIPKLQSGMSIAGLVALLALILITAEFLALASQLLLRRKKKPPVEGMMVGRIYRLAAVFAAILGLAYGFGKLATFGTFFSLFGGMLLGWSLQAPVSGIAAWVLVSLKRPFRPGDRIQFPNLGLVGDVHDTGVMYTMLNQVGGTIGSEEAVGRYILVPNAMLFSQVVINYTVTQDSPYMLDEVITRITFDSDWEAAERILLTAAVDITSDIIKATGVEPYIRSDMYDYGVYLRLRYQTRVKNRAEIAYLINKRIFQEIQGTSTVDLAIPYVYSYRAGMDRRTADKRVSDDIEAKKVKDIEISLIRSDRKVERADIEALAAGIAEKGLLQPIMVAKDPKSDSYDILAGHLRLEACRHLGWKTIPAIVAENRLVGNNLSQVSQ